MTPIVMPSVLVLENIMWFTCGRKLCLRSQRGAGTCRAVLNKRWLALVPCCHGIKSIRDCQVLCQRGPVSGICRQSD